MKRNAPWIRMVLLLSVILIITGFTPGSKTGDALPDFSLKNVTGKMVSLKDYKSARGFIIVFTCNHCPFAKLYPERLNDLNQTYAPKGFPLLAISSNSAADIPDDSYEHMVQRAKEKRYTFPYLWDETQSVARLFHASKTPEAFVIFKEQQHWILKYTGAIDDNGAHPGEVKNRYVANAVEALLHGRAVEVPVTKGVGCSIKFRGEQN